MLDSIFITGLYRSGTTLLEKLLHNHPKCFVASQPFPKLYLKIKKQFLASKDTFSKLPLNDLFKNNTVFEFTKYLEETTISKKNLDEILEGIGSKSRLKNFITDKIDLRISEGNFYDFFKEINFQLSQSIKKEPIIRGSKEVFCEEFIPYFLSKGAKVILIIRDPRDIITSLNFGKGPDFTGEIRPILFNIRNWRKSVAFALKYQNHKNFFFIKYEDLVLNSTRVLNEICQFLNVDNFEESFMQNRLKDQYGEIWSGNSSHNNKKDIIFSNSINRYKEFLDEKTIHYIETICLPELNYLDYKYCVNGRNFKKIISNFKEPFEIKRKEFEYYYSINQNHIKEEIKRLELLKEQSNDKIINDWFIFKKTFVELEQKINF